MATIAFLPVPEAGHLFESLGLARRLAARGHHVRYLSIPDFEGAVREQGFDFAPVFAEQFPPGFLAEVARVASRGGLRATFRELRRMLALGKACVELAVTRRSRVLIEGDPPDLALVDAYLSVAALLFYEARVPTAILHGLPMTRDPLVPPLTSPIVPRDTLGTRLAIAWAWRSLFLRQRLVRTLFLDETAVTRRLAVACGFPLAGINTATSFMSPALDLPEILLAPRELDFPRPDVPGRHYVGATVDLDRREPELDWSRLDARRPLVYCSLGSQSHLYPRARALLRAVLDALAARPDWQGLVAVGPHLPLADFPAPDNAVVVDFAPQLAVLRRARVMITHGGLGAVRECLHHGVPMVVFPLQRDQPGNAARVVYHGLGVMGDARRATAATVQALVDQVLGAPDIRAAVERMGGALRETDALGRAADVAESLLRRPEGLEEGAGRGAPAPTG